ncbi:MAG: monovalent cation/H(+) antiporter subunit G [Alphaproteobacteria bacterium]|nr:monovalent cation/H(+) antiporter subunit G [Alphaproteobacteria bacterium]
MISQAAHAASWVLIVAGSFFLVAGALGMLRMPDVYTRMHAASVIDTLGATLLILGLAIQAGFTLVTLKLFFVLALLFFFGPVASHALAQAALYAGVEPILDEDRRNRTVPGDTANKDATPESPGKSTPTRPT